MIGKIIRSIEAGHIGVPRILRNKVTEAADAGVTATLEHMPTKKDLVIVPTTDKIISAGPACSPGRATFGFAGFPERVRLQSGAVEKKLARFMQIIPENSKMQKPLIFEIEGSRFELLVDKTGEKTSRATIKQLEPTQGVLVNGKPTTILDIEFDKSGKMISGSLHIGDSKISEAYRFSRTNKNMRSIDHECVYKGHSYDHITYKPIKGTESWTAIKDNENRMGVEIPKLSSEYVIGDPLGCLF